MPQSDTWVTLLDADGVSWRTKYLGGKKGLSAGWRGYSIEKGLDDGDAIRFQLLDKVRSPAPTKPPRFLSFYRTWTGSSATITSRPTSSSSCSKMRTGTRGRRFISPCAGRSRAAGGRSRLTTGSTPATRPSSRSSTRCARARARTPERDPFPFLETPEILTHKAL
jgi:hypothetical protein